MLPDLDDTAQTMLSLIMLKRAPIYPEQLFAKFEGEEWFRVYTANKAVSLGANCRVLEVLLLLAIPDKYQTQIQKAARFVCGAWEEGKGQENTNLSPMYANMLLAQSLVKYMQFWEGRKTYPHLVSMDRIAVILSQLLHRTTQAQQKDSGSWDEGSCEITAYGVLTLANLAVVPWPNAVRDIAFAAINRGRAFLYQNRGEWDTNPTFTWVSKVTFGCRALSQAYCVAAMNASVEVGPWTASVKGLFKEVSTKSPEFLKFYSQLPMFIDKLDSNGHGDNAFFHTTFQESAMFLRLLREKQHVVFPRGEFAKVKYLEYIPFTWVSCNNFETQVDTSIIRDMMIVAMLIYQIDEYMETIVATEFGGHALAPLAIRAMIVQICKDESAQGALYRIGWNGLRRKIPKAMETAISKVEVVLKKFVDYMVEHDKVKQAPSLLSTQLRREVAKFLLAHIQQIEDNARFVVTSAESSAHGRRYTPPRSYHDWLRNTSADHTSCPAVFTFFICMVAGPKAEGFKTARQLYLVTDVGQHLAMMRRQYNDHGSLERDREEGNLNSLDFPEFSNAPRVAHPNDDEGLVEATEKMDIAKKAVLMGLADYERQCLDMAMSVLSEEVPAEVMRAIRLFVEVTDLYGQIGLARDMSTRIK